MGANGGNGWGPYLGVGSKCERARKPNILEGAPKFHILEMQHSCYVERIACGKPNVGPIIICAYKPWGTIPALYEACDCSPFEHTTPMFVPSSNSPFGLMFNRFRRHEQHCQPSRPCLFTRISLWLWWLPWLESQPVVPVITSLTPQWFASVTSFGPSFITPIFLHAGIIHLLLNMLAQVTLSAQIEREMGSGGFILTYFAAGIFGCVPVFEFFPCRGPCLTHMVGMYWVATFHWWEYLLWEPVEQSLVLLRYAFTRLLH